MRPEHATLPAVALTAAMFALTPVLFLMAGAGTTTRLWYLAFAALAGWCGGVLLSDAALSGRRARLRFVLAALGALLMVAVANV